MTSARCRWHTGDHEGQIRQRNFARRAGFGGFKLQI